MVPSIGHISWQRYVKPTTKDDAKNIDFDDSFIYDGIALSPTKRKKPSEQMLREEAIKTFEDWAKKNDKIEY